MSTAWKSIYAYTSLTDSLLTDVVGPFFEITHPGVGCAFWERHFAGGPHLRMRLCGGNNEVSECSNRLKHLVRDWIDDHPSRASSSYSEGFAARLLELEGVAASGEDLAPRADCVIEGIYPDSLGRFASENARRLYENFRCDRGPLAVNMIRQGGDRRDAVFELYLVLALTIGRGDYAAGSVSFKSHWEGFYATFQSERFLHRVEAHYKQRNEELCVIARDVQARWNREDFGAEPILGDWYRVLRNAEADATAALQRGESLFNQYGCAEDVQQGRQSLFASHVRRTSEFVEQLWSSEEFMLHMQRDIRFLRPRVLVNFLYELVSALGLSALDRMVLCHHAFRTVEDLCGVNLNDYLSRSIVRAVSQHAAVDG